MELKTFHKGLITVGTDAMQPTDSYFDATNWIINSDGSLQNEQLEKRITTDVIGIPVGKVLLNETIYLVTYNQNDELNYIYEFVDETLTLKHTFDFKITERIEIKAKYNYLQRPVLYLASKPLRIIEIGKTYLDPENETRWFKSTGTINFQNLQIVNGNLTSGAYSFFARYTDGLIPLTTWSDQSDFISVKTARNIGGNEEQTNHGIQITLNNLNTAYSYIELATAYYTNDGQTLVAYSIGNYKVNSTLVVNFLSDTSKATQLTLEELSQTNYVIDSARTITEYKNLLVLGNITNEINDTDLEQWAKTIEIQCLESTFNIEPHVTPTITTSGNKISTNRINILNIAPTYMRSEIYAFAVAIKFKNGKISNAFHIPCLNTAYTSRPGGWVTTKQYVSSETYKGFNITHHIMPPRGNYDTFFPTLALRAVFTQDLPDSIRNEVEGVYILRQERTTKNNRRIESQGIAKPLIKKGTQAVYEIPPFNGKGQFKYVDEHEDGSGNDISYDWFDTTARDTWFEQKLVAYYSPDTCFGVPFQGDTLEYATTIKGRVLGTGFDFTQYNLGTFYDGNKNIVDYNNEYGSIEWLAGRTAINASVNIPATYSPDQAIPYRIPLNNSTAIVSILEEKGTNILSLNSIPRRYDESSTLNNAYRYGYFIEVEGSPAFKVYPDRSLYNALDPTNSILHTEVFNVVNTNAAQYGKLENAEYIPCGYINYNNSLTTVNITNGDTWLVRYGMVLKSRVASNIRDTTVLWTTFECRHNYNLSYFDTTLQNIFPLETTLHNTEEPFGIMDVNGDKGWPITYNTGYSATKNIKKFFAKSLAEQNITKFPNTLVWTNQHTEGARYDGWATLLPNNSITITSSKGAITNTFTNAGKFYAITENGFFENYGYQQSLINTSTGDITIGSGGMFPQPFIELSQPSQGGMGSKSWGLQTPAGFTWVDSINKKIYLFNGEIKDIGINIRNILEEQVTNDIEILYDYQERRILFNLNKIQNGLYTYSYSLRNSNWVAKHYNTLHKFGFTQGIKSYVASLSGNIYSLSEGNHAACSIKIVNNDNFATNKNFDRITVVTQTYKNGIRYPAETFTKYRAYNDLLDTTLLPLINVNNYETSISNGLKTVPSQEGFNIAIPGAIKEIVNGEVITDPNKQFKTRMSGKYCIHYLEYNYVDEEGASLYDKIKCIQLYGVQYANRMFVR